MVSAPLERGRGHGKVKKIRIAVVGSGIAGLSCAWLLSQRHDVTLIEADHRLGGHAHTVDVGTGAHKQAIDTGFIVSNTWTYPNFTALMDYLDQDMVETPMTFSVSMDKRRYEYSGDHLGTLIGRPRQWLDPRHWRMMADLVRFYRSAQDDAKTALAELTLGEYLQTAGYGEAFMRRHILPIAGAIWSSTPDQIAAYPFKAFIDFFANHQLFILGKRPDWRTVKGGSREYVEKLVADGKFETRLGAPVKRIMRHMHNVDVELAHGETLNFDHVVLATHADQALRLLDGPSEDERSLLSPFQTSDNTAYLHRDESLMPQTRRFWSAWNYCGHQNGREEKLSVTYWMNALQKLQSPTQHFVSLNPPVLPHENMLDGIYSYRHPIFNAATLQAQKRLWSLQGVKRTWFCGAWFGAGFHEDGLQAGLAVAEQLGGLVRPWDVAAPSGRIHVHDLNIGEQETFLPAAE